MTDDERNECYGEDGSAKTTPVKPAPAKQPPKLLPPWKVILHNDDVNPMTDVVSIVRLLTTLKKQEAVERVFEAHNSGSALLLVTHQERAELYVEQFASCGLTVTAEPDA